jgi:hypothetical protein
MKRFLTYIIAFIYLTFSVGATVHLHYCMGEFVKMSWSDTNSGSCAKCGMETHAADNGCCKDVQVTAKISDAHYSTHVDHTFQYPYEHIISYLLAVDDALHEIESSHVLSPIINSSPGESPLYIQFCNLRI